MWPNPEFAADLVTFTEEILNEKLHFLSNAGTFSNVMTKDQFPLKENFPWKSKWANFIAWNLRHI